MSKIFSPKQLVPAKVKIPSEGLTTIFPDKDNGNRMTVSHDTGKVDCIEEPFKIVRSNKDADGIFTTISFYDVNDVLRKESILSKTTGDKYDTRTIVYYHYEQGLPQTFIETFNLEYDVDGDLVSENMVVPDQVINIFEVDLMEPLTDGTQVTTLETQQWTASVSWEPNDDPYNPGVSYTATVTIVPKEGYTLVGVPANSFTFMGSISATHESNSGVVTVLYPDTSLRYHHI